MLSVADTFYSYNGGTVRSEFDDVEQVVVFDIQVVERFTALQCKLVPVERDVRFVAQSELCDELPEGDAHGLFFGYPHCLRVRLPSQRDVDFGARRILRCTCAVFRLGGRQHIIDEEELAFRCKI